ncbi:MAG: phage tail protein [Lachnospiraceae bacterium]|nr:phage tail protein [Lachnospiraceae bacterium]
MAQVQENVSVAKPVVGGAISVAPIGTALPTDAITPLANTYKSLGYLSDDGITVTNEMETEEIKAFGGDVVLKPQTKHTANFEYTMIEQNEQAFKLYYGESNVEVTSGTGAIKIKLNSKLRPHEIIVIDLLLSDGRVRREVIPNGQVVETGEISYKDDEAIGYKVKCEAYPYGSDGDKSYIYIDTPASNVQNAIKEAVKEK